MNLIVPGVILIVLCLLYLFMVFPRCSMRAKLLPYIGQSFAHRGYHSPKNNIPENSIPAFQRALDHHMGIEIDVHLTADNQLVVFHDDNLKRMCGIGATVESKTLSELKQLNLGNTSEQIPALSEFLTLVHGQVPLLIEIKLPSGNPTVCQYLQAMLDDYHGAYLVQSFNPIALKWYKENRPDILRGQLSCNLTLDNKENPYIFRFLARFLLTNFLCRPDFISYKFRDRKNFSVTFLRKCFHVPTALWTLHTPDEYKTTAAEFDMMIFEEPKIKEM